MIPGTAPRVPGFGDAFDALSCVFYRVLQFLRKNLQKRRSYEVYAALPGALNPIKIHLLCKINKNTKSKSALFQFVSKKSLLTNNLQL